MDDRLAIASLFPIWADCDADGTVAFRGGCWGGGVGETRSVILDCRVALEFSTLTGTLLLLLGWVVVAAAASLLLLLLLLLSSFCFFRGLAGPDVVRGLRVVAGFSFFSASALVDSRFLRGFFTLDSAVRGAVADADFLRG